MPETFARIASGVLALAFGWAAIAKLINFASWRTVLGRYGFPQRLRGVTSVATPVLELAIGAVILFISPRIGAVMAIAALGLFSLAILNARTLNGDRLPCGCFGASSERDYKTMLVRNGVLGAVTAAVLLSENGIESALLRIPSGADAVPALLALAGCALIVWIAWHTSTSMRRGEHH